MKKILFFFFCIPFVGSTQSIFTYVDFNQFFQACNNGYFLQIEHNAVADVRMGDELIAYTNSQRDFKVYTGKETKLLTNQIVQYKLSDHLLVWNIGPIINYFENGKSRTITSFGGEYAVSDSLIVYQDVRYNTLNAIYKGQVTQLVQLTGDLYMPEILGDNVIVFRDNGNLYKVFWRGQIFEIGVWNGQQKFEFSAGTDIVAFNDPNTRTFAVFENGQFLDVEDFYVAKIKACRGFVVYEDIQGNLNYYGRGVQKELASFFQNWDAKDDVVVWGEANSTFSLKDGEKFQICNYGIKEWKLHNDVIAFRTNVGGVAASVNNVVKEITNLTNNEFEINGHGVMVVLPNKSVIVLNNGQLYRN